MRKIVFLLILFCTVTSAYPASGNDDVTNGVINGTFVKSKAEQKAEDKALEDKLCGKPCPEFTLTDSDGKLWTNQTIRGKVTLINIWHIYCESCVSEAPLLNELMKKYPGANFLAVTFNTSQQVENATLKSKLAFHQLPDAVNFISKTGVVVTPTNLLIDKAGKIRYVIRGGSEKQQKLLNKRMKALSKEVL